MFRAVKGTRDIAPEEMEKILYIVDKIKEMCKLYGFLPLETPALESFELLAKKSGAGIKDEIYYFRDKGGRELGLRFDLTTSLARFVANNPNLIKPFKRYQIGRVWRYDNPQKGRYREFWQADMDIVGSKSMLADTECIALACEILKKTGLGSFVIRINNRKISEAIALKSGVKRNKIIEVFRVLDKLDKIGKDSVEKELLKMGAGKVINFLDKVEGEDLSFIEREVKGIKTGEEGVGEIREILRYAGMFGIREYLKVDLSLVRGLDYYTGPVFEIDAGYGLSVGGGGRYDKLIGLIGNYDVPAVGISFGIDRLIDLMNERGIKIGRDEEKVFIAVISKELIKDYIMIANKLRERGIVVEMDIMDRGLRNQLEYASKSNFKYVIFLGKREKAQGIVKIRDMESGKEEEVKINDIKRFFK
ncbi:MAG TPA: histidine--tRNA ligase [Candidatus Aenigmarchaeota archaeon]|nr:MAG: histidine--tRNA ligase [Candidatus Aenigmarchaeota archaeon]HDD46464.1 histidine--tRNA ligase [Candidatus Aenigmarchaeota archaeon]